MIIKSLALALGLALAQPALAQPTPAAPVSAVPTTRILAIGTLTGDRQSQAFRQVMPQEVRATVDLYLKGKIDQWYVKQDQSGVVFILNVTSTEEARGLLEALPLGEARLMHFDLVPLGPLNPLRLLLKP
jgi:hypothetical protein